MTSTRTPAARQLKPQGKDAIGPDALRDAGRARRRAEHRAHAHDKKGRFERKHIPTAALRKLVFERRLTGETRVSIAAELGMHCGTLREIYDTELTAAEAEWNDAVTCAIVRMASSAKQPVMSIFYAKARMNWVEAQPGAPPPTDARPLELHVHVVPSDPERSDFDETIRHPTLENGIIVHREPRPNDKGH
ncbi:hypothetical protein SAMN05444161_3153 [Rhizobiales bacterium GAS191]|nr:hypothetical protein SAMN05444161_3153 [Rhizobiales bacterium GAS191]